MFEPKGQRVSLLSVVDQMCPFSAVVHSLTLLSWLLLTKKDWVNECVFFLWVCSCLPQICPPLLSFSPSLPPPSFPLLSSCLKKKTKQKLGRNVLIERWPKSFFNFMWKLLLCFFTSLSSFLNLLPPLPDF